MDNKLWKNIKIEQVLEIFVLTAVACLTISSFGGYYLIITTIGKHSRALNKIALWLLLFKLVGTRYRKKEFFIILGLGALALWNYEKSGNTDAIYNILMLSCLKNVDLKKVFKVSLLSLIFSATVVGAIALLGISGDISITMDYGRGGVETRYCFGFIHPNQWAHAMFMIMLYSVCSFWEKLDWRHAVAMLALNVLVYRLAISRTSMICGMALVILFLLCRYAKKIIEWKPAQILIPLGICTVWIFLACALGNWAGGKWMRANMDGFFTGRLWMARLFLDRYPPTLFGAHIPDVIEDNLVLDLGYVRGLLENGKILMLVMLIGIIILSVYAIRKREYAMLISILCLCFYGIYEHISIAKIPANVTIYYLSVLFFQDTVKKRNVKKLKKA